MKICFILVQKTLAYMVNFYGENSGLSLRFKESKLRTEISLYHEHKSFGDYLSY